MGQTDRPSITPKGTEDLPVNGNGKREFKIPVSMMISAVMALFGLLTFSATFLFATKAEVEAKSSATVKEIGKVEVQVTEVKGDIKAIKIVQTGIQGDQKELKQEQRYMSRKQDVVDDNLRRLLRARGIPAARKAKPEPKEE